MNARNYAVAGGITAVVVAVFVFLAYSHVILVPHLSPTILEIHGLKDTYSINDKTSFTVTAKGYGSNCHMLQVEARGQNGERASYYKKADDCRFMTITHGPYNFTRSFEYGNEVLGTQGTYTLDIQFQDLVDGSGASQTRSFMVNAR
ncbi:MAG: hypothetical protein ABI347_02725 [Nitrososphaera sp.]|jgi:hypothetical protein